MKFRAIVACGLLLGATVAPSMAFAEPLNCKFGSSSKWGSGWCDLKPAITLKEGQCVRATVGGTASQVILRVIRAGENPGKENTFLGEMVTLGPDRIVVVRVPRNLDKVKTISVHGGKRAWSVTFDSGNGPASAEKVEYGDCGDFSG
ncbi:MAG: hypothetical protein OEY97_01920 [Nitrospirota bacterium]|nr:hypothetical protein [Nitrospirota bacterium]